MMASEVKQEAVKKIEGAGIMFLRRREALGVSQQAVADAAGIERPMISNIEKGKVPGVTMATMLLIEDALERLESTSAKATADKARQGNTAWGGCGTGGKEHKAA